VLENQNEVVHYYQLVLEGKLRPVMNRFGTTRSLLRSLAAAALAGCADGTVDPTLPAGSFAATITGGVSATMAGSAKFVPDLPQSGTGTAFLLRAEENGAETGEGAFLYRFSATPLAAGTYAITAGEEDDAAFSAGFSMDAGHQGSLTCTALDGRLVVTAASADQIVGTASYTGSCSPAGGTGDPIAFSLTMELDAERGNFGPGTGGMAAVSASHQ
jgi:hypothetical protein